MPDPALEDALTDVRKAYRLLWAYQRRIYDMVELAAGEFDDMNFYWWTTLHADRPVQSGTNPMNGRWAWDMLPMARVSYLFLSSDTDRNRTMPGQWMLEVHVDSDGGFEENEEGTEPDPETFASAAESASSMTLYAWYCTAESGRNWLNGVYRVIDWPEDGEVMESAEPPFRVFGKTMAIAELSTRADVTNFVHAFQEEASAALGVPLE
jgi:hypothetical protein